MTQSALSRKLQVKAGRRLLVLDAPPEVRGLIEPLPDGSSADTAPKHGRAYGVVLAYAQDRASLERIAPVAIGAAEDDAAVWFAYPKRSSGVDTDITRDAGWDVLAGLGWRPVAQIAIDETWSALRFRPAEHGRPGT